MKFRPVRETLEEAMNEVLEFNDIKELSVFLECQSSDIEIIPQGHDDRINWESNLVLVNKNPIGYIDLPKESI